MQSAKMHLYCAFWFNEIEVNRNSTICGLLALSKYKELGACSVCKENKGCKVKCAALNCKEVMHPICAKES